MEEKKTDLIQLLSVNNLVPLLGTIIAAAVFIFKLQAGNELITYKLDQRNKADGYSGTTNPYPFLSENDPHKQDKEKVIQVKQKMEECRKLLETSTELLNSLTIL